MKFTVKCNNNTHSTDTESEREWEREAWATKTNNQQQISQEDNGKRRQKRLIVCKCVYVQVRALKIGNVLDVLLSCCADSLIVVKILRIINVGSARAMKVIEIMIGGAALNKQNARRNLMAIRWTGKIGVKKGRKIKHHHQITLDSN